MPGTTATSRVGVELDAVVRAVALGDRAAQARQAAERGVAVDLGVRRRLGQRLHHVLGRADLGISAAEVDDRRAAVGRGGGDPTDERAEVLLGKALEPAGTRTPRRA